MQHAPAFVPHPVVSGVYILFQDRKITYVGKSKDAYGRIAAHRTNGRPFDYAMVSACPEADLAWVEAAFIAAFSPPENKTLKPKVHGNSIFARALTLRPIPAPVPKGTLPPDPNMVVSKQDALDYARLFGKRSALAAALESGEVPMARLGGKGSGIQIKVGDIKAFCGAST